MKGRRERPAKSKGVYKVLYLFVKVVNNMKVLFIRAGIKTEGEAIYVYIWKIWKIQDDVCLVEVEI